MQMNNMFVNLIVRPPRNQYPSDSGVTTSQNYGGFACSSYNFAIKNSKNEDLQCTFTTLTNPEEGIQRPCVVYMHGNAGNKQEGNSLAPLLLSQGIDLFTFDFSGCGNSGGEWVTLGWKEQEDLMAVLQSLAQGGKTSKVAFWGRSMGAATAILFDEDTSPVPISCMVLDSAFSNF